MHRLLPAARLAVLVVLAAWLGWVLMRKPEELTLSLPDRGVTVSAPRHLEGWVLKPGEGDILVRGHTRLGLASFEIAIVPVSEESHLQAYLEERYARLKEAHREYVVWRRGADTRSGRRNAPTYQATYRGKILGPLQGRILQQDTYWPYRGRYARISFRYPALLAAYVHPDKAYIASRIKLEQAGGTP